MPAHLFRSYVNRHGGINLTNVEWKTFLLVANTRNELFDYSHSGYGIIVVNPAGWMRIPPPQVTTWRKHPRPEEHLTAIFDFICGIYLEDVDLQRETKDMDTAHFKFYVNSTWEMERGKRTNPGLLDYPAMPDGFTWDPAGDELLDACIYYSDHFVDAPLGQGIARRANVHAPSPQAPKRQRNAHETLTEGDPMRLGLKDLLGDPLPQGPDDEDERRPPLLPRPIDRPIKGRFGAARSKTSSRTRGEAGGQPNRIYKPHRGPGANDSQPASPDWDASHLGGTKPSFEEQFGNLGLGEPSRKGVKPTGTTETYRPGAQPTRTYRSYRPPGGG
ncbi:hypothetical protein OCU04_008453 [Sclerotinia nivalis]|uniref:Uncharacterized protein n=1 Tax=Sclerotinia nivalis TaxID=352851 RepID=A0A9X0AI37_9HELO|nr:hypothetical protein OCU04_008453 [Sclerotinia nivalis]